jgi:hypothetical protein
MPPYDCLVVTNQLPWGFCYEMMTEIAAALTARGLRVRKYVINSSRMDDQAQAFAKDVVQQVQRNPHLFIVDMMNRRRLNTLDGLRQIPIFNVFTDAPYVMHEDVLSMTASSVIGYSDRNHREYLEDMGVGCRHVFFPHAGPEPDAGWPASRDRPIPILLMAHFRSRPSRRDFLASFGATDPLVLRLIDTTLDRIIDDNREPYIAFKDSCRDLSVDWRQAFTAETLARLVGELTIWVERETRYRILRQLDGLPVHIAGVISDDYFDWRPETLVRLGAQTTTECLALLRQSKILCNTIAVRPDGAHERLWYGVASGAAVVTDASALVAGDFRNGRDMFFFEKGYRRVRDTVETMLHDTDLDAVTTAARHIYRRRHTWNRRVSILLEAVNRSSPKQATANGRG